MYEYKFISIVTKRKEVRPKLFTYHYWCELHVYYPLRQDCEHQEYLLLQWM
jgi:hypothetical protein